MEGEYKQVTVLFADVASFTALAESLNPEECYVLMRRCFDLMLEEVHRYEGTVTQFLGDGILALFGAPIAHEDHAQRAVRAALGIQRALRTYQQELQESRGIRFRMRMGLNSGLVVVGTIGTDLSMTYTALGDTVNLGDRVRELAEPGTVVISQDTHRLVSGYFVAREMGAHAVKGKEEPVTAYEVLRPRRWRSRVDIYAERGLAPMVGREAELALLLERYAAACEGRGQIALVRGEAGIGKSRLVHEFKRRLEGQERTWLEGRCISFGGDIAYFPLIDLLKDRFEIEETDSEPEIAAKVEAGVSRLGSGLTESAPFLKQLLAVDPGEGSIATMDPQMRRLRTFEALRDVLLAEAAVRPLVVLVEDLHWIDPLSEQFLVWFTETAPDHPLLLVLTSRRGYDPRFRPGKAVTLIDLQNLSRTESAAVVHGLLGASTVPGELDELIHRKAEGNPFFAEEVTKSLLETGAIRRSGTSYSLDRPVEEIFVPDTVQDVIMARLDRLPEEPKRALQTASVIGREFTVRLLERTAELPDRIATCVKELQAVELIYERALYPELAFMFKHALTHDAAYSSLLVARRKLLHQLVGVAIEELYRERLAEEYEALAYHYERAEVWEKALEYLLKSAEKALASFAPRQAIAFYDRALATFARSGHVLSPEQAIAIYFGRGQAQSQISAWADSLVSFQAMLEAAREVGDTFQEGIALFQASMAHLFDHRFEEALEYAERTRLLGRATNNPVALAGSLVVPAGVRCATGDIEGLSVQCEELLRVSREAGIPIIEGLGHLLVASVEHWRGDDARALDHAQEITRISREHRLGQIFPSALWGEGAVQCSRGEYDEALRIFKEGIELTTRLDDKFWSPRLLNTLGWLYMDLCHWDLALQTNREAAAASRVLGDPETIRYSDINVGNCYLALGQLDEAQRVLETVWHDCRQPGTWGGEWLKWRYTQYLDASLGELWLARGDTERALAFADACLAAAEAKHCPRNIVKGRRLRGEVFLTLQRWEEAEAELVEALRVAREVGNPAQIRMTLAVLGGLRQAQGRPKEARAAFEEAIAIVEGVAAALSDVSPRETLLASPQAAALREAIAAPSGG
jgi:class 3 adenylate cyclase/tetratricopeptide (TPR) repeat protein